MLILMIGIDFARVFFPHQTVTNCARNGALYACDPNGFSKYGSTTAAGAADGTTLTNPTLTTSNVTSASGTDRDGNPYVAVTVTYSFPLATNYLTSFVGSSSINLTRTVQMRVAQTTPD
jgi:hypothetical protein